MPWMLMHLDKNLWTTYGWGLNLDAQTGAKDQYPHSYHVDILSENGFDYQNLVRVWIGPNSLYTGDPCDFTVYAPTFYNYLDDPKWEGVNIDEWERQGFWQLFQFESDPNFGTGDPNGKFLRGAIWYGGKYDWDGKWLLECECTGPFYSNYPVMSLYWPEGIMALAAASETQYLNGPPADCGFDDIEVRTGLFSSVPRNLSLLVKTIDKGTVTIDPDLLVGMDDPNNDPNDPNQPRQYTDGTEIVLVATPVPGKSWRAWKIYDPNHPGDSNYAVEDSNTVLYLTMDADYDVEAIFKCGSSDMLPPVGMVLLALGLGLVARRIF
jgi:hypothetical protein